MNNRTSKEFGKLLKKLKRQAGPRYSDVDLAKQCNVKMHSIYQWFNGRACGADRVGNIARYFSEVTDKSFFDLYSVVENARCNREKKKIVTGKRIWLYFQLCQHHKLFH